jgi:hypothetical protein
VNFLFRNAIGKKIEPFQLHYQNGTTLDYKPGDKVLCMLFWRKVEAKKAPAANAAPKPAANTAPKPEAATAGEGMMNPTDIPGAFPEEASLAVFEDLFKAGTSGQIKFAAINLDPSDNQKTAEEEMITRSQAWSQVVATGQTEGQFSEFNTISPNKPVLMIADSAGTIRYAGPATGFIVPMLLAKIVPSPTTSTDAATKEVPTDGNSPAVTDGNSLPTNSNLPAAADSNSLPADGNSVSPAGQKPTPTPQAAKPQAQYKELSEEDKVQADKLINYADGLFMKAAGKRIITYKQGVELCRQVMKDYPGSEYADKARLLLRQVPENQRSKYGITDQELGL